MKISQTGYPVNISKKLVTILEKEISKSKIDGGCCIVFRDSSYLPGAGGYHPVEVSINASGRIQYITDFSLVGFGDQVELAKELDFDFSHSVFQQMGRDYPIQSGRGLFRMFQSNFCSYYESGAFDQIEVTRL